MRRFLTWSASVLVLALVASACSVVKAKPAMNVRPPAPGVPATGDAVTGIYRSIHQGVLQFRKNGGFVLIVPAGPGASAGTFTLRDGRLEVRSKPCGDQTGTYDAVVTGTQEAGKSVLNLSAVQDPCTDRRYYLTVDPWVYANS